CEIMLPPFSKGVVEWRKDQLRRGRNLSGGAGVRIEAFDDGSETAANSTCFARGGASSAPEPGASNSCGVDAAQSDAGAQEFSRAHSGGESASSPSHQLPSWKVLSSCGASPPRIRNAALAGPSVSRPSRA